MISQITNAWVDPEKNLGGQAKQLIYRHKIRVAQLNVLLELQLRTSLVISKMLVC